MTDKEKTDEEKLREASIANLKNNTFQVVHGADEISREPGEFGSMSYRASRTAYEKAKADETYAKIRKDLTNEAIDQSGGRTYLETIEIPSWMVTNKIRATVDQSLRVVRPSELEAIAKEAGAKLTDEAKVPGDLDGVYDVVMGKIIEAAKEGKKYEIKDEREAYAMQVHGALQEAYTLACAEKAGKSNIYEGVNGKLKALNEKYSPKSEGK